MPTPRKPLPVTKQAGMRGQQPRRSPPSRSRWPTSCCALARSKRYDARQAADRRAMPSSGRRAASDRATSSASDCSSASGSRAPPTNVRISTDPSGARCGHFDDSHDAARMPVRLDARHDVARSVQADARRRRASKRERDRGGRRVGDFGARGGRSRRRRSRTSAAVTYAGVARPRGRALVCEAPGRRPTWKRLALRAPRRCV